MWYALCECLYVLINFYIINNLSVGLVHFVPHSLPGCVQGGSFTYFCLAVLLLFIYTCIYLVLPAYCVCIYIYIITFIIYITHSFFDFLSWLH